MTEAEDFWPDGTKVKVKDYPKFTPRAIDYNGMTGEIRGHLYAGKGIESKNIYNYTVFFSQIKVPYARFNKETSKYDRGIEIVDAQENFDSEYLEKVEEHNVWNVERTTI